MKSFIFIRTDSIIAAMGLKALLEQLPGANVSIIYHLDELIPYRRITDCNLIYISEYKYLIPQDNTPAFHSSTYFDQLVIASTPGNYIPNEITGTIRFDASREEIIALVEAFMNRPPKEGIAPHSESELTQRELEVLKLVALGHSNKEVAAKLFISAHTVITHRKNISEKLGIRSASGLTVYAIINHLIDTDTIDPNALI